MRKIYFLILLALMLLFSGCSVTTIHPPSASGFMEISEKPILYNTSGSVVGGTFVTDDHFIYDTDKVSKRLRCDDEWEYRELEWNFIFKASMLKKERLFPILHRI